ncbi:MAG TPA: DUF6364 family protein [Longimicrobium sp.]|nr:DUF6364 family protein [Longimicrobium sp.]
MAKVIANLSLDEEAVKRGERYAELHSTSVSKLVSDFLSRLPVEEEWQRELPPVVRRLYGVAAGAGVDEKDYLRYLEDKYGV